MNKTLYKRTSNSLIPSALLVYRVRPHLISCSKLQLLCPLLRTCSRCMQVSVIMNLASE